MRAWIHHPLVPQRGASLESPGTICLPYEIHVNEEPSEFHWGGEDNILMLFSIFTGTSSSLHPPNFIPGFTRTNTKSNTKVLENLVP
jgi:hypothetical protein